MSDRWCFLIERMMTPKSRERVVFTMLGVKVEMFVENSCDLRIFDAGPQSGVMLMLQPWKCESRKI